MFNFNPSGKSIDKSVEFNTIQICQIISYFQQSVYFPKLR